MPCNPIRDELAAEAEEPPDGPTKRSDASNPPLAFLLFTAAPTAAANDVAAEVALGTEEALRRGGTLIVAVVAVVAVVTFAVADMAA
jgi:hypothetical protein